MNIENTQELQDYLSSQGILPAGADCQSQLLTGGVSNRTVKVDFNGYSWVIKQALQKLRVSGDWFSAPERIYYEAEAIRWFDHYLPGTCPKLVFEDKPSFIMAMESVPEPFRNLKELLLEPEPPTEYFSKAGKLLGQIHSKGIIKESIPELFFDTQFFESLRIDPYYVECQKQVFQTQEFFNQLIQESRSDRYTFTHGDYSPKNLLIKNDQLVLLDHEVAHFGDGTFDLGFFIAHLISKANYHSHHFHVFLEGINDFFKSYLAQAAIDPPREKRAVNHSIGCMLARVCGLSQLEYLNPYQKKIQKSVALNLIESSPLTIPDMLSTFAELLAIEKRKNP